VPWHSIQCHNTESVQFVDFIAPHCHVTLPNMKINIWMFWHWTFGINITTQGLKVCLFVWWCLTLVFTTCIQIITLLSYPFRLVYSVFVLLLFLHCFIFMPVLLLCYVSRSSLYCSIHSELCTLCLSCYHFYIVLSLYLYCCYVMYPDHHFTVIH
jgi:hypothetical protein